MLCFSLNKLDQHELNKYNPIRYLFHTIKMICSFSWSEPLRNWNDF